MKERFRINPIEGIVLAAMAVLFCQSAYNLAFGLDQLRAAPLGTGSQTLAMTFQTAARNPASHPSALRSLDLKCEGSESSAEPLSAAKIRLTGPLCGAPSPAAKLIKTQIINGANKYAATVFTDLNTQKFSTDYIPLVAGPNAIHVEFSYQGGKTYSRDLTVDRN